MRRKGSIPGERPPSFFQRAARSVVTLLVCATITVTLVSPSTASDYDPKEAGHPLRIIAYLLHPIGAFLDYCIMRPAYRLGQKEPCATIFGTKSKTAGAEKPGEGS